MKNLELFNLIHKPCKDTFTTVTLYTQTADSIFFIRDDSLHRYDPAHGTTTSLCPHRFEHAFHLKSLVIENKICVVTRHHLHILDPDGADEPLSLDFDKEVAAISWNPTEELIAVVFHDGEVSTFGVDYENGEIFPRGKSSVGAEIPDTVYVGWGSKMTQFRGSEGKLKEQKPAETRPVLDKNPTISWRGNGEMFVVNYWVSEKRQFIVFETPCKALYRSEECPGLQAPVAWRPAGNMIAGLEATAKQSIVIFEKNGQKRFNFDLGFDDKVMVREFKWSPCAQIFLIHTENLESGSQNLHLFTSSNYKWLEKQVLTFRNKNRLVGFDWLETSQFVYTLRAITEHDVITYSFRMVINRNSSGICAVIDGTSVNLTDFTSAIIPPTLYDRKINNQYPINFVTFYNDLIITVDSENNLKFGGSTICLGDVIKDTQIPLSCHHFKVTDDLIFTSGNTVYTLDLQKFQIKNTSEALSNDPNIVFQESTKNYTCQLKSNCHFYLNESKLSDCVNSFVIFDKYLLYTTKRNELLCTRLQHECDKPYRRNIEQGATIITPVPNTSKIVLQLPRGNLETISCRLISTDILDRLLDDENWDEAVRFIRLEKLNANLLFDLNPQRFLGHIKEFIGSVHSINELNSICLEFEEKNWANDKYPDKIKIIFDKLFAYFDSCGYAAYATTIMAINLNFFTVGKALGYLQDLSRRSHSKAVSAINTLKTYGCDQESLYSESLLLYDLDLAHLVATCCQLDPRVYEPQLQTLKGLTEVEMRYEINVFAKKPKVAIGYLLRCAKPQTEEVLAFITTHKVSKEAYASCPKTNRHFQAVSKAFAEELKQKSHLEAGIVYKKAGLLEEALEQFKMGLHWREALDVFGELQKTEVERLELINDLGDRMKYSRVKEAAILYEYYANNYEMAVKVLLNERCFEEAIHIARKYKRGDIILADVIPLLMQKKKWIEGSISCTGTTIVEISARLATVRQKRVDAIEESVDRNDLFSDAGSTITKSSSRSSRSSRKRRKEERKKWDTTPGAVYEDIALVAMLHSTIEYFYKDGEKVRSCCAMLMQETDVSYKEIKKLYDLYWECDSKIQKAVAEIWPPHFRKNYHTEDVKELADLKNFEHLDEKYHRPPDGRKVWKLDFF